MGYFLNLVDLERWEKFLRREDDTWGFAEGRRTEAEKKLQRGTHLVCLLMKRHLWCGVLEVVGGPPPRTTGASPRTAPCRCAFP